MRRLKKKRNSMRVRVRRKTKKHSCPDWVEGGGGKKRVAPRGARDGESSPEERTASEIAQGRRHGRDRKMSLRSPLGIHTGRIRSRRSSIGLPQGTVKDAHSREKTNSRQDSRELPRLPEEDTTAPWGQLGRTKRIQINELTGEKGSAQIRPQSLHDYHSGESLYPSRDSNNGGGGGGEEKPTLCHRSGRALPRLAATSTNTKCRRSIEKEGGRRES